MQFLPLVLPTLAENLALDEALLLRAEQTGGPECLRIWEWPTPAVVLGANGCIAEDVVESSCAASGIPLMRRASGGGTVLLGAGCLCYSLVLSLERTPILQSIRSSHLFIAERFLAALGDLIPLSEMSGTGDLTVGGRKFSGTAQQRKRTHMLHHGTLLYNFDISSIGRYLRLPARQPDYRQQRNHDDFLTNVPLDVPVAIRRLTEAWGAIASSDYPEELVRDLVRDKYGCEEWIRRR